MLHQLYEAEPWDFLSTLEPTNLGWFMYQLGTPRKILKYCRNAHVLNVEYEIRIRIMITGDQSFLGAAEAVISWYLEQTKEPLTYYNHTFYLTKTPIEEKILPVGKDRDFGEAAELAPYVYEV